MWAVKIIAKIVLSRLPVPYGFWSTLGLFRHGKMDTVDYLLKVFNGHAADAFPGGLPSDFTALELGPGDSLASMLVARAMGATKIYLVDAGPFARTSPAFYKDIAAKLAERGLPVPDLANAHSLADIMAACNATYLTDGVRSLVTIPDASIDFIWSQAVLEHVRKAEFQQTSDELCRILSPRGRASHEIDYKDHLVGALNNLRFSHKLWESDLFAKSGFYTNRIQAPAMRDMFDASGYGTVRVHKQSLWTDLPTSRAALHKEFRDVPNDHLKVSCIRVVMTPPSAAAQPHAGV